MGAATLSLSPLKGHDRNAAKKQHVGLIKAQINNQGGWRVGKQNQLPCRSTGTSSGNCQEMETARFGHATHHNSLDKTILQGTLEGGRCCGRQRKCWMDNIKEWTSLLTKITGENRLEEDFC